MRVDVNAAGLDRVARSERVEVGERNVTALAHRAADRVGSGRERGDRGGRAGREFGRVAAVEVGNVNVAARVAARAVGVQETGGLADQGRGVEVNDVNGAVLDVRRVRERVARAHVAHPRLTAVEVLHRRQRVTRIRHLEGLRELVRVNVNALRARDRRPTKCRRLSSGCAAAGEQCCGCGDAETVACKTPCFH